MADTRTGASGNIYDLGYRRYDGIRLGRSHAIWTLFVYSFRGIFGIGRSTMAKVFPIGLAVIAAVPAFVQIAIAAIAPENFEVLKPEDYFGFVAIIVALICAVVAPEMIGRDQRYHTLSLYFSRALARTDYVSAKVASLAVALFLVLAIPQLLVVLGNAVASNDLLGSLRDDADQLGPIITSSVLVAAFMASMSVAIASQTPRRAISTGAVLAYFVIFTAIGGILVDTTSGTAQDVSVLLSPLDLLEGAVRWLFNAPPTEGSTVAKSGLDGGYYALAAVAYTVAAMAVLYRRYIRMTV